MSEAMTLECMTQMFAGQTESRNKLKEVSMAISEKQIKKAMAVAKKYGATRLLLFGSALEKPNLARDLGLACDGVEGWRLYELGARLEEEPGVPLDIIPLSPPSRFTRLIESKAKVLL